jgi:molybdopterin/thiamine biosynthesis adenylyltransferase
VSVPSPGPLQDAVLREMDRISCGTKPKVQVAGIDEATSFDAILCVGTTARRGLPWTVINSNGWLARVSSQGKDISAECSQVNPIGALAAACLGVAEVFKRLIVLRPDRGAMNPGTTFSFYDYCESSSAGPELPSVIPIDLSLFGAGAIGNGIVYLLSVLPVTGRLSVVDRQVFQRENWGTCFLVGPDDFDVPKADWACRILRSKLVTRPIHGSIEDYVAQCERGFLFPSLVSNALDNIDARRLVQRLWPDQIIDGAIGPTACEVTVHPWEGDSSCLLCDFQEPVADAVEIQARTTGLRRSRLADPFALANASDVEAAPATLKDWLRERQGRQICSVVSEAVLSELSAAEHKEGFEPSAPFVACLSACMVVTEIVRHSLAWKSFLSTGFQFDTLVGPQNGILKVHNRKPDCECVTRRKNIDFVRAARRPKHV